MDPTPNQLLRTVPLFNKLNDTQYAALAALAKKEHYHRLVQIVRQGDLGNRFFILINGVVSMRRTTGSGAESPVGALAALSSQPANNVTMAHYFGEQMFSGQEPYDYHADAVTEVDVYYFQYEDFVDLLRTHRHILNALDFIHAAEKKRRKGLDSVGEGEAVALITRKHWWALASKLVLIVIPLALIPFLPFLLQALSLSQYELAAVGIPALILVAALVYQIAEWYNDEYVVTNQRVIHVERNILFQQEVRDSALIDKVQGVTIERYGFISLMLGVSNLIILTPGRDEGNVEFDYIAKADHVRSVIMQQMDVSRARRAAEVREQFRKTVGGELKQYIAPDLRAVPERPALPVSNKKKSIFGGVARTLSNLSSPLKTEFHFQDRVVWRKHWWLLFGKIKNWVGGLALTMILGAVVYRDLPNLGVLFALVAVSLICGWNIFYQWMDWSNDIYAVTDTQIINSELAPFGLSEKTSVASLDQITDVIVDVPNLIGSLLDFGTLKIDTAGKTGQMTFISIHKPRQAQEEIYRRINEFKTRRAREEASVRSSSVVDAIVAYHRMQEDERRAADARNAPPPAEEPRTWDTTNSKFDDET